MFSSEFLFDDGKEETPQREPPQITLVLRNKTVTPGNTAKFACRYKSVTGATVEWSKDGKAIRQDTRHKLEHEGDLCLLTVLKVMESDVGEYTVVVRNEVAQSRSSASLQIDGK